ncbi:MAG: PorT family protein [Bacteroidaceae bacterium]|nr:PorT family protein [Bacteroidaceae bacterium]
MKKITILTIIYTLFTLNIQAQVGEHRRDVAIGINGGYVLNQVSFSPHINQKMHGGITMGATVRYTCEKYFSMICAIQGELNYVQLGWTEDILTADATSIGTYKRNINYLQMPILVNLGFGKEKGGVKGYIVAGPHLGFCFGENESRSGEWSDDNLSDRLQELHNKPIEKKFDYGITLGLGMDICTKNGHHFSLEGRYGLSLSNIFRSTKQDTFSRSANNVITVKVAYLFDILKTRN